jgi:CRP-like cAMP-binding protein
MLLDGLAEADRREIFRLAVRRRFKRREVLFHEGDLGDTLHLIDKGHVMVRIATPGGDSALLTVLRAGESVGEGALLAPDSRRTATASAVDEVETRVIDRAVFEELRHRQPTVERLLTGLLAAQVRRLSGLVSDGLYYSAEQRLMRRLADLAEIFADGASGGAIPLSQDDLATAAGVTRSTANRVLQRAVADGLVDLGRARVHVPDIDALRASCR